MNLYGVKKAFLAGNAVSKGHVVSGKNGASKGHVTSIKELIWGKKSLFGRECSQ